MNILFLAMGFIVTTIFIIKRNTDVTLNIVLIKGFASILFIFTAAGSFLVNSRCPQTLGVMTVLGAVFGLLGDVTLDFKYVYKNHADTYLYSGFVCFLIGHLLYTSGLAIAYGMSDKNVLFAVIGLVVMAVFVPLSEKIMNAKYGKFMFITILYLAVFGFELGYVFSLLFTAGISTHTVLINVGMGLFILSDMFLSPLYFSNDEKCRSNVPAIKLNHIFYYSAQYIIAYSLCFFKG